MLLVQETKDWFQGSQTRIYQISNPKNQKLNIEGRSHQLELSMLSQVASPQTRQFIREESDALTQPMKKVPFPSSLDVGTYCLYR